MENAPTMQHSGNTRVFGVSTPKSFPVFHYLGRFRMFSKIQQGRAEVFFFYQKMVQKAAQYFLAQCIYLSFGLSEGKKWKGGVFLNAIQHF